VIINKKIKNKFLYISKKNRIKIRFIGKQAELYLYFRTASTLVNDLFNSFDASNTFPKCPFFREKDDGDTNYVRSKRIVSLVVDRTDEEIKAFACPISIWNKLINQTKENDFEIWGEGQGLSTRYYVNPLGVSKITGKQKKISKATLESFTFSNIFIDEEWELVEEKIERIKNRWEILDL